MTTAEAVAGGGIAERIAALGPWFHNMELGGVWTAPDHFLGNYPWVKFKRIAPALPDDLRGRTVLDIGCNAGYYAIAMKDRGADRVVAIDTDERYLAQGRFAAEATGKEIEFRRMSVYEVGALGERFDLVLFLGVMYHLRHPLLALDLIHEHVARDLLVVQTMQRGSREVAPVAEDYEFEEQAHFDAPGYPKMHFIEHRYAHDPTNWWTPNRACTEAMIRSAGFEIVTSPESETYVCRCVELSTWGGSTQAVYPSRNPNA